MVKGRIRLRGEDRNVLESLTRKADLTRSDTAMEKRSCSVTRSERGDSFKLRDAHKPTVQTREEGLSRYSDPKSEFARGTVDMHEAVQVDWIDDIPSCPVYHPSKEEFADPLQYLDSIAPEASKYGMCKIVSPLVVSVPAGIVLTKERANFKFTTRMQPTRLANWDMDDKITFPESGRNYSLTDYEKMANRVFARKFSTAANLPTRFVEAQFWKELISGNSCNVEYACDVDGSAFSASDADPLGQSKWNLKGFSRLLRSILRHLGKPIAGVTEPMLYIGMLFSMFAWHVEDHYLYSINYHHCGAPKTWYGVPGHAAADFEKVVQEHVYNEELLRSAGNGAAYDLLIGKTTMFAPKLLLEHDVPVFRAVQMPGEFVITFPRAYHAGFSHGFNCGEAVNFAMADWFPYGAAACWRYELLSRDPLISHEELLCKEAMLIPQALTNSQEEKECLEVNRQRCVKIAFLGMMRVQHQVQWFLKQQGARLIKSDIANVLCGFCKHVCYVSYVVCKCSPEAMCLNHGREIHSCVCGNERSLFITANLSELEVQARKFESENGILSEVTKGPSIFDPSTEDVRSIEEGMLKGDAYQLYLPFCDSNTLEMENIGHKSKHVPDIGVQVEAVACSDSPSNRTSSDMELSSEKLKAPGSVQTTLLTIEEIPKSCSNPVLSEIASLNGKQGEGEEDSDTEAFRVKRRRVLPSGGRSFEIESHETKPKRLKVMLSQSGKKHASEHGSKKGQEKEKVVNEGYHVLVHDVIRELDLKGSVDEVIQLWQAKAGNHGMMLEIKQVVARSKKFEALSIKGCKCLKKILPEEEKLKLGKLMQQSLRKSRPLKVEAYGNEVSQQPCEENQGNTFKSSSLACLKPKSRTPVNMEEQTSVALSDMTKTIIIDKVNAADYTKVKPRKEIGLSRKRQEPQDGFSVNNAADMSEGMRKTNVLSSIESSVQARHDENLKGKKQKVSCKNTESVHAFKIAHVCVGSMQGKSSGGVSVKYSKSQDKDHTQKAGCLKVKGPSPPVYKVKRGRSSSGTEREKEDIARKGANKESSNSQHDKRISNHTYGGQFVADGMPLPVERDCSKQNGRQQVKKASDISSSIAVMNLESCEYPGKPRTDTSSELEPKKGLIIHLNQKVEPASESLASQVVDDLQEKEETITATGNILDQRENVTPAIETALCPNQEAASSFVSHCVQGLTIADESCLNQDAASGCAGLSVLKDKVTVTGESWKKSDLLADNMLEEGELRESGIGVAVANKKSGKDSQENAVHSGEIAPPHFPHDSECLFAEAREQKKNEEYRLGKRSPGSGFLPCARDTSMNVNTTSTVSMDFGLYPLFNNDKVEMWTSENIKKESDSSRGLNTIAKSSSPSESMNHLGNQQKHPSRMFPSDGIPCQWQSEDIDTAQDRGTCLLNNSGLESETISRPGSESTSVSALGLKNAGLSCNQFCKGDVTSRTPSFDAVTRSLNKAGKQTGPKLGLHSGQRTKTTPLGGATLGEGWIVNGCEQSGFGSDVSPLALAKDSEDVFPLIRNRTCSTVATNVNQKGMHISRPASSHVQFKRNNFHYQRHCYPYVDRFRSFKHPQASFYQTKERMPYASRLLRQQRPVTGSWGTDEVDTNNLPTVNNTRVERIFDGAAVDSVMDNSTGSGNYCYSDAYDLPAWGSSPSSSSSSSARQWQYRPTQVQTPNGISCGRVSHLQEVPPLQALGQYNFEEAYSRW